MELVQNVPRPNTADFPVETLGDLRHPKRCQQRPKWTFEASEVQGLEMHFFDFKGGWFCLLELREDYRSYVDA